MSSSSSGQLWSEDEDMRDVVEENWIKSSLIQIKLHVAAISPKKKATVINGSSFFSEEEKNNFGVD